MPKGIPKLGKRKKGGGRKNQNKTANQVQIVIHREDKERLRKIKGKDTFKDFIKKILDHYTILKK